MGVVARFHVSNDMTNFQTRKQSASGNFTRPGQLDEKHLADMLRKLNDPVTARIFLGVVYDYPDLEMRFLGSYLQALETVKRSQIQYAKARDLGLICARLCFKSAQCAYWLCRLSLKLFVRLREWSRSAQLKKSRVTQAANDEKVICLPHASKATGTNN